ncbi:hypothetical protein [Stackebrandtia nassauensis]|uniref:Uncharacterized protein n=1 Tax=Stackebrandtia nassauensis (strain DSM 44728 / CIP 108903 / NRRL B-16338 / NBRC 102104 / LLR-40K-21) TaxID=446470 RepID=D3PYV3_STANL|nr:hypothetical protein [Stackebrandtia nassauensis]ADD43536.1 hypothetical protein Snas_3881 [Stackebrandtia nassauensis DSM 44728]
MNRGHRRERRQRPGQVRAQLVTEFTRIRRLKLATFGVVAAAVVAAVPVALRLDDVTRDPAFVALDELALPHWASAKPRDAAAGSRWCVGRCRVRERVWQSKRGVDDTVKVYAGALSTEHWHRLDSGRCPTRTQLGQYRCYHRDEYALDLWVRPAECPDVKQLCPGSTVSAVIRPTPEAE